MVFDFKMLRHLFLESVAEEQPEWDLVFRTWFRNRMLATLITGMVLGEDWFERNLADANRQAYFQTDIDDEDTFPRFHMRVIELGEMILNLFNVENFEERMNETRNDRQTIETKISELIGAKLFRRLGVNFKFRLPVGRKKSDYDIDYVRMDGKLGRCEVKSKLQGTAFSTKTIIDTLKAAKSQLPKGETGIISLRLPEEWVPFHNGTSELLAISEAIAGWINTEKTTRVSAILQVDNRTDVVNGRVLSNLYYQEHVNRYCHDVSGLPPFDQNTSQKNWISIPDLVQQWLE